MEEARGDVDVVVAVGGRRLEEPLPVTVGRLVGLDVLGDDREVDRHAEPRWDAAIRSRSVFERMASFQPRSRSSASAAGTSGNGGHSGSECAERAGLALGSWMLSSWASRSSASVITSR